MLRKILSFNIWTFHLQLVPLFIWLSIKARSLTFFTAVNPCMYLSGMLEYSKYDILEKLPPAIVPKSYITQINEPVDTIIEKVQEQGIPYPLFAKPDAGELGWNVEKLDSEDELRAYLAVAQTSIIIQEFISYPCEYSVLYYKLPNQTTGQISSLVHKKFSFITGNGKTNIQQLIEQNFDDVLAKRLIKHVEDKKHLILQEGERMQVNFIGNVSRGAVCSNEAHLITPQLIQVFDNICGQVDGFYFGRFDLKVPSFEDLLAGKNIKVVELNGVNSLPLHVFVPNTPLSTIYQDMSQHWKTIYEIGQLNQKSGIPYAPTLEVIKKIAFHQKKKQN